MKKPTHLDCVGRLVAIRWSDGSESVFDTAVLRRHSPSAENRGEVDILGQRHGGSQAPVDPSVEVLSWEWVGNYAVRFTFSDGHATGIFSWPFLLELEASTENKDPGRKAGS